MLQQSREIAPSASFGSPGIPISFGHSTEHAHYCLLLHHRKTEGRALEELEVQPSVYSQQARANLSDHTTAATVASELSG